VRNDRRQRALSSASIASKIRAKAESLRANEHLFTCFLILTINAVATCTGFSRHPLPPQLFFRPESNRSTLLERSATNAQRRGAHSPPEPPADVEQAGGRRADRIGRQLAAESSAARNARSGPNGWTSAGPPRKLKVGPRGQRMHTRMDVRDKPSLRREDSAQ